MEAEEKPSEPLVRDFMRPLDSYHYVNAESTVRETLPLMDKARQEGKPLCLVVLDENSPEKNRWKVKKF